MKSLVSFLENVDAAEKEKAQREAAHAKMREAGVKARQAQTQASDDARAQQEAEARSRRKEAFKNRLRKQRVRFSDDEVD